MPSISSLSPTSGPPEGGTLVTIIGDGFVDVSSVTFGGSDAASFSVDSDTQIGAETPSGLSEGDVEVIVTTADGPSDSASFTIVAAAQPVIDAVDPTVVDGDGGTTITVTGSGFTGVTDVTIAGIAASFAVDSDTRLEVEVPPLQQEGTVELVVVTGSGTASASLTAAAASCTVTAFNVPTGRSGCTKVGGKAGEKFRMEADSSAPCRCCEYRQYVRGSFTANGRPVRHLLPDPAGGAARPMLPRPTPGSPSDNFLEDGVASPPAGINAFYGHRSESNTDPSDRYLPDRASGCQYRGSDFPGLRGSTGMTYAIELDFRGQVIDVCGGNAVKNTNDWTVSCSGAI